MLSLVEKHTAEKFITTFRCKLDISRMGCECVGAFGNRGTKCSTDHVAAH
jgi:hypothetical protein